MAEDAQQVPPATPPAEPPKEEDIAARVSKKLAELADFEKKLDETLKLAKEKIAIQGTALMQPPDTRTAEEKRKAEINDFLKDTGMSI